MARSMLAWRYIGSVSSKNWMNPIASAPSSTRKPDSPSSGCSASWTERAGSPHHMATLGSAKMAPSAASSSGRTGRSLTRPPLSTGELCDGRLSFALDERHHLAQHVGQDEGLEAHSGDA